MMDYVKSETCQTLKILSFLLDHSYSGVSLSRTPSISNFSLSLTIFSVPFR